MAVVDTMNFRYALRGP